jgi:hypothetical protein
MEAYTPKPRIMVLNGAAGRIRRSVARLDHTPKRYSEIQPFLYAIFPRKLIWTSKTGAMIRAGYLVEFESASNSGHSRSPVLSKADPRATWPYRVPYTN